MVGLAIPPHAVIEAYDVNHHVVGVDAVVVNNANGQPVTPQSAKEFVLAFPRCAYTCARATFSHGMTLRIFHTQRLVESATLMWPEAQNMPNFNAIEKRIGALWPSLFKHDCSQHPHPSSTESNPKTTKSKTEDSITKTKTSNSDSSGCLLDSSKSLSSNSEIGSLSHSVTAGDVRVNTAADYDINSTNICNVKMSSGDTHFDANASKQVSAEAKALSLDSCTSCSEGSPTNSTIDIGVWGGTPQLPNISKQLTPEDTPILFDSHTSCSGDSSTTSASIRTDCKNGTDTQCCAFANQEVLVTAALFCETTDSMSDGGNIWRVALHVAAVPNVDMKAGLCVVVVDGVRNIPVAKDARWIEDRKVFESMKTYPSATQYSPIHEALLSKNGRALEGLISNFFVVLPGPVIATATDNVLCGSTRHAVITACEELGVPMRFEALRLDGVGNWDGAFLTSAVKIVCPVTNILRQSKSVEHGEIPDHTQVELSSCSAVATAQLLDEIRARTGQILWR